MCPLVPAAYLYLHFLAFLPCFCAQQQPALVPCPAALHAGLGIGSSILRWVGIGVVPGFWLLWALHAVESIRKGLSCLWQKLALPLWPCTSCTHTCRCESLPHSLMRFFLLVFDWMGSWESKHPGCLTERRGLLPAGSECIISKPLAAFSSKVCELLGASFPFWLPGSTLRLLRVNY